MGQQHLRVHPVGRVGAGAPGKVTKLGEWQRGGAESCPLHAVPSFFSFVAKMNSCPPPLRAHSPGEGSGGKGRGSS